MPDFLPGLQLCGLFYQEILRPILETEFPGLPYSAALIGSGSEVLGFDTEMSTDHDWGPRLLLFLPEEDHPRLYEALSVALSHKLPPTFRGYPTSFAPNDNGTRRLEGSEQGLV